MKWISVYEKKPKIGQTVLLLLANGNPVIGKFDGLYFVDDGLQIDNITHWCKIPVIKTNLGIDPYNYDNIDFFDQRNNNIN